ncbi:TraB/GumN family protein [Pararhizobium haloflavum]|uniref:TraB/GumN family protein n=1 Tax=Pararhizobium haloflavum TaxID=2037914 RepID=UPI000C174D86|nr:TraB/GumN family protein [Pararhizobium haloflavum]
MKKDQMAPLHRTPIGLLKAEDRFARMTLATLGAVHAIVMLSLILVLLAIGNQAFAQEMADTEECGGANLVEAMRRDDPQGLETLLAEAEATPNGSGLLWRIEDDGAAPSWLFGTMHVSDPQVTELAPETEKAFNAAATIVIETDEIIDPERAQSAILARPELTMFTDGETLESLMKPGDYALVSERLEELGLPVAAVTRMKPWMVAGLIALPACEMARKAKGEAFLDKMLAEEAIAKGKVLKGLETVEEQLTAMAELPMEFHLDGLVETVSLGPLLDDVMTTMTDLYLEGKTGMILPMIRQAAPAGSQIDGEGYAAFEERIILARNRLMAERAVPIISEGNAFIAVGALHLPGEEGLIALLRDAGYRVTRVE